MTAVDGYRSTATPSAGRYGNFLQQSLYKTAVESGEFPASEHSHVEDDLDEIY